MDLKKSKAEWMQPELEKLSIVETLDGPNDTDGEQFIANADGFVADYGS